MLALGLALGSPGAAASMGAGALLVGISSLLAGAHPARTAAAVTVAMALATFAGSASGSIGWLHLLILVPWAFAAGMAGSLGREAGSVGVQSVMAMVVFGRFAESPLLALELAGYVAAGGAAQVVAALVSGSAGGLGQQRRLVAACYRALAELARSVLAGDARALASAEALEEAGRAVSVPAMFGTSSLQPLVALVAEGRRIRLELAAIAGLSRQLSRHAPSALEGDLRLELQSAVSRLSALAASLAAVPGRRVVRAPRKQEGGGVGHEGRQPVERATRTGAASAVEDAAHLAQRASAPAHSGDEVAAVGVPRPSRVGPALVAAVGEHARALAGQLRAAERLAADVAGAPWRPALPALSLARPLRLAVLARRLLVSGRETLAANWSLRSPQLRHGVRLMVVLPLCELLALLTSLPRGYWITLTAGVVLRPDFGATLSRGATRVAGTLVGAALAGLIVLGRPTGAATVVLVGLLAFGALATFQASYALFSCALTALVVVLLGIVTTDSLGTAGYRTLATVIGGAIALAAYLAWPTWSAGDAVESLGRLVLAQREYLGQVLSTVSGEIERDGRALAGAARSARIERAAAEEAVGRSLTDPSDRRIDAARAAATLAALRRLVLAVHAVRVELEDGTLRVPMPQLAPLAGALGEALSLLAGSLAGSLRGTPAARLPPLRSLHGALAGPSPTTAPSSPSSPPPPRSSTPSTRPGRASAERRSQERLPTRAAPPAAAARRLAGGEAGKGRPWQATSTAGRPAPALSASAATSP